MILPDKLSFVKLQYGMVARFTPPRNPVALRGEMGGDAERKFRRVRGGLFEPEGEEIAEPGGAGRDEGVTPQESGTRWESAARRSACSRPYIPDVSMNIPSLRHLSKARFGMADMSYGITIVAAACG